MTWASWGEGRGWCGETLEVRADLTTCGERRSEEGEGGIPLRTFRAGQEGGQLQEEL